MDILKLYLDSAAEIIGERTAEEEKYDREVTRWIAKGEPIKVAILKANKKYPDEALLPEEASLPDLQERYEYLLEHEKILSKLRR